MSEAHWSQMMLPRERIEQLENVNRELRTQLEQAEARVAYLENSIRNAAGWIDGDLRDIIRDVGNRICDYNDLYDSADRIEELLVQALPGQADELEAGKAGGEHGSQDQ